MRMAARCRLADGWRNCFRPCWRRNSGSSSNECPSRCVRRCAAAVVAGCGGVCRCEANTAKLSKTQHLFFHSFLFFLFFFQNSAKHSITQQPCRSGSLPFWNAPCCTQLACTSVLRAPVLWSAVFSRACGAGGRDALRGARCDPPGHRMPAHSGGVGVPRLCGGHAVRRAAMSLVPLAARF